MTLYKGNILIVRDYLKDMKEVYKEVINTLKQAKTTITLFANLKQGLILNYKLGDKVLINMKNFVIVSSKQKLKV